MIDKTTFKTALPQPKYWILGQQSAYQNWTPGLPTTDQVRDFVYLGSSGWSHDVQNANRTAIGNTGLPVNDFCGSKSRNVLSTPV